MSSSTDPADEPCNFNKLPPELRIQIWELAASNDRNVLMISDRKEAIVTIPPPAMAWTCHESRAIAFQYGHVYRVGDKWTWFSPVFDRVALDAAWTFRRKSVYEIGRKLKLLTGSLANDVRHVLASSDNDVKGYSIDDTWATCRRVTLYPSIEVFPNLQSVGIMREAVLASDSTWNYYSLEQLLQNVRFQAFTLIREIESESRILASIPKDTFARSYPGDWMGQSVNRTVPQSWEMGHSRYVWDREKQHLRAIWKLWFYQRFAMTPTTLPRVLGGIKWGSDKFPWMNQVKDQAPFVYPAVLLAHGNKIMEVVDHPDFKEEELRQLQHHAMQAWFLDTFGDQALADADAEEEAAT
ncbi:hypothetical protein PG985_016299 [Apiospora marii]|uniref:2EXR domain-containing protein n=1 Tax=Apiospora marii TaxID=335849 RepID=A0ABR1SVV8_9PEZI